MTIGERIKQRRCQLGLTVDQVAEKIGKNRATVYRYESSEIEKFPIDILEPLANALRTSPAYLMGWESEPAQEKLSIVPTGFDPVPVTKTVPRIGRIACGDPITAEENIDGYDSTLDSWNADFTLLCVGDSMAPKIVDGDVVAIRSQPTVENGEIAAVRVENEATLKQVFFRGKYLELRPINPNYESLMFFEEEMNQVHIEGKAVGLCRGL